jgi:hypothetical protein
VGHCGGMTRDEAPGQWANDLNITLEPAMGTVSGASPGVTVIGASGVPLHLRLQEFHVVVQQTKRAWEQVS